MEQHSTKRSSEGRFDSMILAFGQLVQPTSADEVYAFSDKTLVRESLTRTEFDARFKWLERNGFFWRTADNRYVVTPKGEALGLASMDSKKRDKMRLLILNRQRYKT
jgi:hypothetical protein